MKHIVNGVSKADKPYISHDKEDRFIANIKDGTHIGYKYVALTGMHDISVMTRGSPEGVLEVYADTVKIGEALLQPSQSWKKAGTEIEFRGVVPLFFSYRGQGVFDFKEFCIQNR